MTSQSGSAVEERGKGEDPVEQRESGSDKPSGPGSVSEPVSWPEKTSGPGLSGPEKPSGPGTSSLFVEARGSPEQRPGFGSSVVVPVGRGMAPTKGFFVGMGKEKPSPIFTKDLMDDLHEMAKKHIGQIHMCQYYEQLVRAVLALSADLERWTKLVFKYLMNHLVNAGRRDLKKKGSALISDKMGTYKDLCKIEVKFLLEEEGVLDEVDIIKFARLGENLIKDIQELRDIHLDGNWTKIY